MLAPIAIAALVGQTLAGAIPRDNGSKPQTTSDGLSPRTTDGSSPIFRSFTLPAIPLPTIIFDKKEAAPEPEPEAEPEAEPEMPSNGQTFGSSPDPTQVQITGLTYGGTGCPANSIGSALSADRTVITLIMSDYVASIGPGIAITENRKNCQINLALQYPGGFQYSILSADYRGYADLDPGITGNQKSTYYFSGQIAQTTTGTTWKGPYVNDYEIVDQAASTSIVWSPCGAAGMLNINSQLSLTSTNKTNSGFLTTDSIDTSFVQQVHVAWQPCTASK